MWLKLGLRAVSKWTLAAALAHMKEASTCTVKREEGGLENFLHIDSITVWLRNRMWFPATFGSRDSCGWRENRNTLKAL